MIKYITTINGEEYEVEILEYDQVSVNGKIYKVDFEEVQGQRVYTMLIDGRSYEAHVSEEDDEWRVLMKGTLYAAEVIDERARRLKAAGSQGSSGTGEYLLKAPMPGLVVEVPIKVGDQITKGDVLLILESMKMQNELKAPRDGIVGEINVKEGDSIEQRQILVTLEPQADE